MIYSRVKDCYTITYANGVTFSIDIANGILYGKTGKPIKNRAPYMIGNPFINLLFDQYRYAKDGWIFCTEFTNRIFIDRLISLPETTIDNDLKDTYIHLFAADHYPYNNDTKERERLWKVFMDMVKNHKDELGNYLPTDGYNCWFKEMIKQFECSCTLKKYGFEKLYEYFVRYSSARFDKEYFSYKAYREALKHIINNKYDMAKEKVAELFGTDDEDILKEVYGIRFFEYDYYRAIDNVNDKMRNIFDYIDRLHLENYKLTNLDRDYDALKMRYEEEKTKVDNAFFKKNQTKYDLHFENDDFETYVPTTRQELEEIGKTFSNCANGWEWNRRLSGGRYYLVVVQDKATKAPLVCCDIENPYEEAHLHISQYLAYGNDEVNKSFKDQTIVSKLTSFKAEYQLYLYNLKGGGK